MGRAPCCDKANVKRGPWAPEEDSKLKEYIEKYGTGGNWIALPQKAGLRRCGKSCRLRWLNYLRPNIKHGEFTDEEDRIILTLFATIGSRWSIIASQLPGRTDNDIKNYWNTKLKKKLMSATIPNPNHRIISSSPSSLTFPHSNIYLQDFPLLPSQSQTLSSSLPYRDSLCSPSFNHISNIAPITKSSLFSGLDFTQSVPPISPISDNNYHPMDPSSMIQTHEGNGANPVEILQYDCSQMMNSTQERADHFQGFISNGSAEGHNQIQWGEKRNDGYYGESNVSGSSAIDYDLEEVNRLIGSSNSGSDNSSFLSSLY